MGSEYSTKAIVDAPASPMALVDHQIYPPQNLQHRVQNHALHALTITTLYAAAFLCRQRPCHS